MSKLAGIMREGFVAVILSYLLFGLVLFPDVPRGLEQIKRMQTGYDRLAGSNSSELNSFVDEITGSGIPPESYIDRHIAYASDIDVWNNFDYWETPEELIVRGTTDCEGKAILVKAVFNVLSERNKQQVSSEIKQQMHHAYVEVKRQENVSGVLLNTTVPVYKIEEPTLSEADKIVTGFRGFIDEVPPVRQALLSFGLVAIWGRYFVRIRRMYAKKIIR